jgi:elongation factor Ts
MANISAALVKELRDITGAGMMECKNALLETEGKVDDAIDYLRTRGLASLAKKAGRATDEGAIASFVSTDNKIGTLIEVNCETDFVGSNATFTSFVAWLAQMVTDQNPADIDTLKGLTCPDSGLTVEQTFGEIVGKLGENMAVARFVREEIEGTGAVETYIHAGAKIGIMVTYAFGKQETADNAAFKQYARDVAMQVAAADPIAVTRDDFDSAIVEHELSIYKAQAAESGKPENIQEKMAEGRLHKFFKEQALVEQAFVKDPDISIDDLTKRVSKEVDDVITVVAFVRYNLGENA